MAVGWPRWVDTVSATSTLRTLNPSFACGTEQGGLLIEDPRSTGQRWRKALQPVVGDRVSLLPDVSPVAEVGRRGGREACWLRDLKPADVWPKPPRPAPTPLQLLNVAYARHELVSDTTDVSLAWLEAGGKTRVAALEQQQGEGQRRRRRLRQNG